MPFSTPLRSRAIVQQLMETGVDRNQFFSVFPLLLSSSEKSTNFPSILRASRLHGIERNVARIPSSFLYSKFVRVEKDSLRKEKGKARYLINIA